MNFDFRTFWDADDTMLRARALLIVDAMVQSGKFTEAEAKEMVEAVQHDSFEQGMLEENFNNCGEDA